MESYEETLKKEYFLAKKKAGTYKIPDYLNEHILAPLFKKKYFARFYSFFERRFYLSELRKEKGWTEEMKKNFLVEIKIRQDKNKKLKAVEVKEKDSPPPLLYDIYYFAKYFLLAEHLKDRSIRPVEEFPEKEKDTKKSGYTLGYVTESGGNKFVIKIPKRAPYAPQLRPENARPEQEYMNEAIIGPLYRYVLHGQAPILGIVANKPIPLWSDKTPRGTDTTQPYLSSKFLPGFHTLSELTESKESSLLGPKTDNLNNIEGVEKVFAACLIFADIDFHAGNVGVIETGDAKKPQMTLAKIDQGYAAYAFFTNPALLLENFAQIYADNYHQGLLSLKANELKEALTSMIALLSNEQIEKFINAKIYQLQQMGINIQSIDFVYTIDGLELLGSFADFDDLKNFYIEHLKQQRDTLKQVRDRLAIISKIELPPAGNERDKWVNGGWLATIRGQDPIAWAAMHGKEIAGMDPILYAVINGKMINGKTPISWAINDSYFGGSRLAGLWQSRHMEDLNRYNLLVAKDFKALLISCYSDQVLTSEKAVIQQLDNKLKNAGQPPLKSGPTISKWRQYLKLEKQSSQPLDFSEEELALINQWKEKASSERKLLAEDVEAIEKWCKNLESASEVNLAEWGQEFIDEIKKLRRCLDYLDKTQKDFINATRDLITANLLCKSDETNPENRKLLSAAKKTENAARNAVASATKDLVKQIINIVYPTPLAEERLLQWVQPPKLERKVNRNF